jgi:hypothetical protein
MRHIHDFPHFAGESELDRNWQHGVLYALELGFPRVVLRNSTRLTTGAGIGRRVSGGRLYTGE